MENIFCFILTNSSDTSLFFRTLSQFSHFPLRFRYDQDNEQHCVRNLKCVKATNWRLLMDQMFLSAGSGKCDTCKVAELSSPCQGVSKSPVRFPSHPKILLVRSH